MKKAILIGMLLFGILLIISIANGETTSKFEKIIQFKKDQFGSAVLSNKDNLLILDMSNDKSEQWIEWYQDGKVLKSLKNAGGCVYSPDGGYYAYLGIKDKIIYINNNKDKAVGKIEAGKHGAYFVWSYDSKHLIIRDGINPMIYKYNVLTKVSEKILGSNKNYFYPITVNNTNLIYLLLNKTPEDPDTNCDIVKYDIQHKRFETIKFPFIEDLWIYSDFTISPNEKIAVFQNVSEKDFAMYVVDLKTLKVIDRIELPANSQLSNFSWKPDSSYFLFTTTMKEVYKYTIPKY